MKDRSITPLVEDTLPFRCEAWARRVHKCQSQCDACFRKEYEPRLRRAEKLLREFIVTCEVHKVKDFFDLLTDVESARVYFKEETPVPALEQSESGDTLDQLMTQRLPSIQHEAREYIRRMRLLDGGDIDEQKMRFAEAALSVPAKKPRATASPYDVGGNPTKDYPGE